MEQKEIIVYDQEGKIVDCNFHRIDMNNPQTILSYCDDVKDTISAILESTAQMSVDTEAVKIDEKLIGNITGFDESLDESEKQAKKKNLPIVSGVKSILTRMGIEKYKKEEEMATYKGRYLDYCSKIEEVIHALEAQKQASLSDIELRNRIVEEVNPLIKQLEEMIKVAHIDRENFAEELKVLAEGPKSLDTDYLVQYRTQLLEVLDGKITELEKSLVLYKTQIQQYRVQQATEMQAVMSADSYIKDTAPILKAQGSVMLFNREQTQRLETLKSLNEASNLALIQNASDLAENANGAVELSLNNGISVDTLEELDASLRKGIEVFQNGRKLKVDQIKAEQLALARLNEQLESYQQEVLYLIDNKEVISGVLEDKTSTKTITKGRKK